MANINDYIDWRGDLTFSASPFNNIDNLIFTELCFLNFTGIVPTELSGEPVSLSWAINRYFEICSSEDRNLGFMIPGEINTMAKKMAASKRYGGLKLSAFINTTDVSRQYQFCALTIFLSDGTAFVAFRGTDDTLVGWREDFNMMFTFPVPSQVYAADYVVRLLEYFDGNLRLGGHSKGGNLALYAAACCPAELRDRIIKVYNNDGPGFGHEMISSEGYNAIKSKIVMIIPQASVVGMLFEHEDTYMIVKSNANGILQHDGYSWEVLGTDFIPFDSLTKDSIILDKSIRSIVSQMDDEESKKFVDALFEVLGSSNAQTLTELMNNKNALVKSIKTVPGESRDLVIRTIMKIISESSHVWLSTVKSNTSAQSRKSVKAFSVSKPPSSTDKSKKSCNKPISASKEKKEGGSVSIKNAGARASEKTSSISKKQPQSPILQTELAKKLFLTKESKSNNESPHSSHVTDNQKDK